MDIWLIVVIMVDTSSRSIINGLIMVDSGEYWSGHVSYVPLPASAEGPAYVSVTALLVT